MARICVCAFNPQLSAINLYGQVQPPTLELQKFEFGTSHLESRLDSFS